MCVDGAQVVWEVGGLRTSLQCWKHFFWIVKQLLDDVSPSPAPVHIFPPPFLLSSLTSFPTHSHPSPSTRSHLCGPPLPHSHPSTPSLDLSLSCHSPRSRKSLTHMHSPILTYILHMPPLTHSFTSVNSLTHTPSLIHAHLSTPSLNSPLLASFTFIPSSLITHSTH